MDLTHVPGDLTQMGQGMHAVPRVRPYSGRGLVPRPPLGMVRGLAAAKHHQENSGAGKGRAGPGPGCERPLTFTPRTRNSARALLILVAAVGWSLLWAMTLTSRES